MTSDVRVGLPKQGCVRVPQHVRRDVHAGPRGNEREEALDRAPADRRVPGDRGEELRGRTIEFFRCWR
jgi:hypothetical protein